MPKAKTALITGITGQDGSYLAELLLGKGYRVFGLARRESWYRPNSASHLADKIDILFGDISEGVDIASAFQDAKPDEVYNLASQSRPGESWARAPETLTVNGLGTIRLLEAVRHNFPECRVYQASSSEMFGNAANSPQDESTPFNPLNPYAASKAYAYQMATIYRQSYGLYICNGILFNHESERRPLHFLTQKVCYGAACAALKIENSALLNELGKPIVENGKLALGNLEIARDWGYAGDFVKAMWLMLQLDEPIDFVIGTGKLHTLRQLCQTAYDCVGLDWQDYVFSDPNLVRPLESGLSLANPERARELLGWSPEVSFEAMIRSMVRTHEKHLKAS